MPSEIALNKVAEELPKLPKYFFICSRSGLVLPAVSLKSRRTSVKSMPKIQMTRAINVKEQNNDFNVPGPEYAEQAP